MEEQKYLLYVELPNLINRIMKEASIPPVKMNQIIKIGEEIKKVSIAEVNSAIETVKNFI